MTEKDKSILYTVSYVIIAMLFVFRHAMKIVNSIIGSSDR